jgi:hypothetical protein
LTEVLVWIALAAAIYLWFTDTSALAVRLAGHPLPPLVNDLAGRRVWPAQPGKDPGLLDSLGSHVVLAVVPQLTPVLGLAGFYGPLPRPLAGACVMALILALAWALYLVVIVRRSRPA